MPPDAPLEPPELPETPWASLFVVPSPLTLAPGEHVTPQLMGRRRSWEDAQPWPEAVAWRVEDDAIARIEGGALIALRAGTTHLVAWAQGQEVRALVEVAAPSAARISLEPSRLLLPSQGSATLLARVSDEQGLPLDAARITWRSAEPGVAQVDAAGHVSALVPGVTQIIIASVGDVEASATLTVRAVARLALTPAEGELEVGQRLQLSLSFWSALDEPLPPPDVPITWTNHTPSLADLTEDRALIALEPGRALVSAQLRAGLRADAAVRQHVRLASLRCGATSCCGPDRAGALYCWGRHAARLLGAAPSAWTRAPARLSTDERFSSVTLGATHQCGVTSSGQPRCWGENSLGVLGVGDALPRYLPWPVRGERSVAQLAAGRDATCALEALTGHLYCWGATPLGHAAATLPTTRFVDAPQRISDEAFTALALRSALCARRASDGRWLCMGHNEQGQTGTGIVSLASVFEPSVWSTLDQLTPLDGPALRHIALGLYAGCGLDDTDHVWCWGEDRADQLGWPSDPSSGANKPSPRRTSWSNRYTTIVAGDRFFCGLNLLRQVECWGSNLNYVIGSQINSSPTPIPTLGSPEDVAELTAGDSFVCALTTAGAAWCWGCAPHDGRCDATPRRVPSFVE